MGGPGIGGKAMKAGKHARAKAAGNLARARWRLVSTRSRSGRNGFDRGPGGNSKRVTQRPKGKR